MKTKFLIFFLFLFFLNKNLIANEVEVISDNIQILENGNIIKSKNSKAQIKKKKLFLESNDSIYNKKKQIIFLEKNIIFLDEAEDIKILAKKAKYSLKNDILSTTGETNIFYENKYEIISEGIVYDRGAQFIFSNNETTIKDHIGNV